MRDRPRARRAVVVLGARLEPLHQVRQCGDPEAAGQVIVEGRDRLAEERGVVGQGRVAPATARRRADIEVEPARRRVVERRRQSPRRPGRRVPFPDMGQSHSAAVAGQAGANVSGHRAVEVKLAGLVDRPVRHAGSASR